MLDEHDVDPDPLRQFERWFADARAAGIRLPEAMALATTAPDGTPSARMLLLKDVDDRGFVFYTGYESRKARELGESGRAALVFHWDALGRQVRVEGEVERVPGPESDAYFATRPRGSRLGAWASEQSTPIGSRDTLEAQLTEVERRFGDGEIPRPERWGGYVLRPRAIELWEHRDDRLHDRLLYRRAERGWTLQRLSP